LAIETSCDETSLAIVEAKGGLKNPQFKIVKNLVSSQIAIHRPFGGVVPNLAKREHIKNLPVLYKKLYSTSDLLKLDLIAVTVGPGLAPALWTGIEFAKKLAAELDKPLIGINHLKGHLYSCWLNAKEKIKFPATGLIVSGGHTILIQMSSMTDWQKLGETRDDAAGEAFDKVARMLGLSYPGGPEIEKLAKLGDPGSIPFPRPMLNSKNRNRNYEFSFSGLKTAVLYYLQDNKNASKKNVAAAAQEAIAEVLVQKTIRAAIEFQSRSVLLSGGVASNQRLKSWLRLEAKKQKMRFYTSPQKYNTDNAAIIGIAGYIAEFIAELPNSKLALSAQSNLNL